MCVCVCVCVRSSSWFHCVFPDPNRRGLERGDVQRDPIPGGRAVRDVVLHLLHRADSVWKLYPFPPIAVHVLLLSYQSPSRIPVKSQFCASQA